MFLAFFSLAASAQVKIISGKVIDSKDGSGLSNVSILGVGGTSKSGSQTDGDGSFKITVPASATRLVFLLIGYEKKEITLNGQTSVNVSLASTSEQINEVIVIGYGTARRKDLTGAVASVQSKDFNQGVMVAPDQLLQNKVAGLEITTNSGQPGASTTIKIRGNNSIRSGNNPLFVVDGVPLDGRNARPIISNSTLGSTPDANALTYINPNDIASIDVLKDASSAAIYGSRGANGVIVITTKTGTSGPAKIEVGASWGINAGYMKRFDILKASEFRSALTKYGITGQDKGASVDALKEVSNTNISPTYSLALSGGNENGRFRASFLGSTTNGIIKNSSLDKYVGSFSGQYKFLDKRLTLAFSAIVGHTTENIVGLSNAGSNGNLISSILQWNPTTPFDSAGIYTYPTNGSGNPKAFLAAISDKALVNTVLANISASYKIFDNLEYKFLYAINNSTGSRATNDYAFLNYNGIGGLGFGALSNAALVSQTYTNTLDYKANIGKQLHVDAIAGFEYWTSNFSNNFISASGFNTNLTQATFISQPYTNALQDGNALSVPTTYVDPEIELQSYFGRVQLNYADKYAITATLRADGSSRFGSNNKYGYFPSVGAKWAIINENFMKNNRVFSNLAFRASWGITGNQDFPAGASQEQFRFSSFGVSGQTNVYNANLKWEQTKSYNFGLDFASKNNKIYGSIDYYNKNTTNVLFQSIAIQPAPTSISFQNLPSHLMNTGIEISVGLNLVNKQDFTWDLSGNYSYNKNLLKDFTLNGTNIFIPTGTLNGQGVSGTNIEAITNNQPVDVFNLKAFNSFDSIGGQKIGNDPSFIGDPNPHSNYGISTTVRIKKITLSINGGGAGGYSVYNETATDVTNIAGISSGRNISRSAYNSVEKPTSGVGASTRFLESGNFFKIRNATISYHVGNAGKYIKNLNAFVTGNNLLIFTKFTGFDPEVSIDKNVNSYPSRSIEYLPYPTGRTVLVGLNFSL